MKIESLVLASNNNHKISEIKSLLADCHIRILTRSDFNEFPDIEETGATLKDNALLKSRAICAKYKLPALADDSGLEVDFLNGQPGVLSARYAGEGCTFADNNRKLLKQLDGVPDEKRGARFVTVLALSATEGEYCFEGEVRGVITESEQGSNGFGYDPVFYYPPLKKTFAQLAANEKNGVSHRANALLKFKKWLLENT